MLKDLIFPDVKRPRGHEKRQPLGLSGLILFTCLAVRRVGAGQLCGSGKSRGRRIRVTVASVLPVFAISRPVLLLPG